jgi:hypothetical protein
MNRKERQELRHSSRSCPQDDLHDASESFTLDSPLACICHCDVKSLSKCIESLPVTPGRLGESASGGSLIRGLRSQTTSGPNDCHKRKYLHCITEPGEETPSLSSAVILVLHIFIGFGTAVPHVVAEPYPLAVCTVGHLSS